MDEQWSAAQFQAGEQRAHSRQRVDACERARRERDADAAAVEGAIDIGGIGEIERDRAPHPERPLQRQRALVVCVDQGKRLLAGKRLDAERARDAEQGAVEAVALHEGCSVRGRLALEVDHVGTLAGEVEHCQAMLSADERELAAVGESLDELLAPEVLVDVDLDHGSRPQTYSTDCRSILCRLAGEGRR